MPHKWQLVNRTVSYETALARIRYAAKNGAHQPELSYLRLNSFAAAMP